MRSGKATKWTQAETPDLVEEGSGNVFAALGLAQPDLALAKAKLVQQIRDAIEKRGLTQVKAGKLLGLDQPNVSALKRGRTDGCSIDRLFRLLNALGRDVEITVRPVRKAKAAAESRVVFG